MGERVARNFKEPAYEFKGPPAIGRSLYGRMVDPTTSRNRPRNFELAKKRVVTRVPGAGSQHEVTSHDSSEPQWTLHGFEERACDLKEFV